ncbi:acVLRF1 family peptidyl-tRNA hydrolase [Nocardioides sp. L-11A]|uniref:acVLRF1 family peptidyl-tRNA hydrolase n=1 Tax=Nocardioides sp. L-11A TaxID=3043848 RepID=UPI00249B2385|nr:acVLRF1 family peptidyl-tRNA hydrolase [Nocardioides sp. L-11A]
MPEVLVPPARWPRWVANFAASHGEPELRVDGGALHGTAPDDSWFRAAPPFSRPYAGAPEVDALAVAAVTDSAAPATWGVLLVRKGGFAIARVEAGAVVASKVGQRHVQGRTKAGGQSQQRFARRRANQARVAYEAAADHAFAVLAGATEVVAGGDRGAVDEVLADPRLSAVDVVGPWLAVPDPRRAVLDRAVLDAQALVVMVENAGAAPAQR